MYVNYGKRVLDVGFAFVLFLLTSPILLLCWIFLKIDSPHLPAVFTQDRVGKDLRIFRIYKYRTMNKKRLPNGELASDEERLTNIGRLLRKTSIDELPQILNILKGDMSFIGPRPLLVEYILLYTPEQNRRHNVLPGISGLAQINGRNSSSWSERFAYDIYYVDNISPQLDAKIFFQTISNVLRRSGISSKTSATMEKFTGEIEDMHHESEVTDIGSGWAR